MKRELIEEIVSEMELKVLPYFIDGHDDAIIGITERMDIGTVIVYDQDKIIEKLIEDMDGDESIDDKEEMALEHFHFNIKGSWIGANGPLIVKTIK